MKLLFPEELLIDTLSEESFTFKKYISLRDELQQQLVVRPLSSKDYSKGIIYRMLILLVCFGRDLIIMGLS